MTSQQQELIAKYRAVPDILRGLVAGISDDDGRIDGEGNDAWSIVEIVCHLRDAETRSIDRTRRMRDEEQPTLLGYDEQELAKLGRYREQSLSEVTAAFIALREEHASELESLDERQWSSGATHNQMGELTIQSITHHMSFHDAVHLAQIGRRAGELRARATS
ncbi:MAG TPA: DinB family protein [Thermomicrobiales bacterium]|nr:DinB family protein [Thermomicrobiales bacterium]